MMRPTGGELDFASFILFITFFMGLGRFDRIGSSNSGVDFRSSTAS